MNDQLPFFNWSLKKVLLTESGSFNKARIKILFTILILSLVKVGVVLWVAYFHEQYFQFARALAILVLYAIILKLLLANKSYVMIVTHVMIWAGILLVWSNIFVSVQKVNVITLQFVFMTIVSSFYFLNRLMGIIYSTLSTLPVMVYLGFSDKISLSLEVTPEGLAAPGPFIIIVLNFITIIMAHYLYHEAFAGNVIEKELLNFQLKKAVEEANKHAQSKSDFLSTMSHELRTPLNSVIGITDLLLDDPANDEQKENLKVLSFSAVSLHALINDILDYNKLDSDKLQLETISVNLRDLMNNVCSGLDIQAKEKGLSLILDIDKDISIQNVITDPTRLTQITYNLVGNGIKFTNNGHIKISLKTLSRNEEHLAIRFSVVDTGIGISTDKHKDVFEPFVQASSNTTRNFGGSGLGLSIVKHLLTLFGSNINLESDIGKGSNFSFDISFVIDKEPAKAKELGNELSYDLTGLRILVAEDNQMNIFLIRKICSRWNIEPTIAENGIEVIEKLQAGSFDVILMDIHMPEMDGYEASRRIRKMDDTVKAAIPIIALTASVSQDMNMKIREVGMDDYVRKPFNSKELYAKLKSIEISTILS
jgi:signal transduction histidine kinase/CheY-like chemotaxis protein